MSALTFSINAALLLSTVLARAAAAQTAPSANVLPPGDTSVRVTAISDNIIRVSYSKDKTFVDHPSFAVIHREGRATPITIDGGVMSILAGGVTAMVANDHVTFLDPKTKQLILAEGDRSLTPVEIQSEKTNHIHQTWLAPAGEALYGLGQHQFGTANLKGLDIDLWQHNTEIAVPFFVSSKGYGILWDCPSPTKFGDPRDFTDIPDDHIFDASGNPGGFTATPYTGSNWGTWTLGNAGTPRVDHAIAGTARAAGGRRGGTQESALRWEGEVLADADGVYKFKLYANGGYKMWLDGALVADHWRQNWLPWDELINATFTKGTKHKIVVEWIKDGGNVCNLMWKPPSGISVPPMQASNGGVAAPQNNADLTSLSSMAADGIDYYFIYGGGEIPGAMDKVLAGYRQLTGKAPMMPVWAFGLWQSRQRYETQQQSLDVVKGFRDRHIPFDNIVQDWMYWPESEWGSHDFDPQRFPDPDKWVKDIHALNAHLMISVWGKFYPPSPNNPGDNFTALNDKGYLYPISPVRDWVGRGYQYAFYDAFNPDARSMFWDQVNKKLFSKGVDAWWMDATEPDLVQPSPPTLDKLLAGMPKTAAGTGASVANAYPLLNSEAVYEGQRAAAPDQRVFILTRCGYAGEQRYATAVWSGDISSTWSAMKKQIAAGLGMSVSGIPYWTMDSGGFAVPSKFSGRQTPEAQGEWRELNTRWLQFAAFVPLMRVHGESPHREMWEFGGNDSDAYKAQLKIDQLRYRLLPFWYSLAGDVTQNDATFMRPVVMETPDDPAAREINDQYFIGNGLLVSPVTTYKARTRSVFLPGVGADWYDFWTGACYASIKRGLITGASQRIEAAAPYDQIPLHVRAGTILPLGPALQYTTEKKPDPLTLLVYTGSEASFSLYEDDGLTYQYEKNAFSRIPISWNEKSQTLTLGQRLGSFPGMLRDRTINVIFITPQKPVPYAADMKFDQTLKYAGDAVMVKP